MISDQQIKTQMKYENKVFIATSMDGYIADKKGGIEWLDSIPEINSIDSGYAAFTADIDALVMGRSTFETVLGFGIDWPYTKPVYVASQSMTDIPDGYIDKIQIVKGTLTEILAAIHKQGHHKLYIDGGRLIQSFLQEDLLDELVITIIPVLLGDGIPLFGALSQMLHFECVETKHFLGKIVQNRYVRQRYVKRKLSSDAE